MSASIAADEREDLHCLLDFILDGPGADKDRAALKALVGIGRIVGAARWAIDHEARRIHAGHERSPASPVLVDERLPLEARQELSELLSEFVDPETVKRWAEAGGQATPEQKRSLARIILHAIGHGSGEHRFEELANALGALNQGEAAPLLRPSKAVARGGHGAPAQIIRHRLRAVLGIEYQLHAGAFRSARAAREKIAELYGVEPDAMRHWPKSIIKVLGQKRFHDYRMFAAFSGLAVQLERGGGWKLPRGFLDRGEKDYGLPSLKADGGRFRKLSAKR
jgi:hypothetical protein